SSIGPGGTATLTFTVTNPAASNPAQTVSFIDTLPSKLQIATNPNVGGTCTGGSVTAAAGGTTITVTNRVVPASPASASSGTIPAASNPAQTVSFTDTLPSKLQIATNPNVGGTCTGGSVTAAAGGTTITVTSRVVPASTASASSCTITVDVTNVPLQTGTCPDANLTDQSANISGLSNLTNAVTPSCVGVTPLVPSLNKAFSPSAITIGGTATLTFTVTNPAAFNPAQAVSFTDTLPSKLQMAATPNVGGTCTGGSVTAAAGANSITVTSRVVPASTASASSCTITVDVTNVPLQTGTCPDANL